jgi:predicted transcriptional regulator YdeE
MKSQKVNLENFKIIGISVRTTNQNAKSAKDIMELWERFYAENISSAIPNKIDNDIYSVYTDYKSDYTADYTTILGHRVNSLENIPASLDGREFVGGNYLEFKAKGVRPLSVFNTWQEIWVKDKELNRKYTADFEIYGKKSQDAENSEVDIFIATV